MVRFSSLLFCKSEEKKNKLLKETSYGFKDKTSFDLIKINFKLSKKNFLFFVVFVLSSI